jgi:TonB family protein
MPVLEKKIEAQVSSPIPEDNRPKQRRRMMIALALLLASLIVVAAKNWSFWSQYLFPSETVSQTDTSDDSSAEITTEVSPVVTPKAGPVAPAHSAKGKTKTSKNTVANPPAADTADAPVVNRAVLPPLQVEVVAGNHHQPVKAGNNSVKVDMGPSETTSSPAPTAAATVAEQNAHQATVIASDRVRLSRDAADVIARPVKPNYPLLARQMKVEGAVVLQALIGKEGNIQDLRVISGPAILSAAAREAVTQWHFKPYYQDGQAVETEARITVNFTISTN